MNMNAELVMQYIKPELVIVAVVLYFVGMLLKKSEMKDKYIPAVLGCTGVFLCAVWVIGNCPIRTPQEIAVAIFTSIVQGILAAGLSTYVNQIVKQAQKDE